MNRSQDNPSMTAHPHSSRRALLGGAALGAGALLAGCGGEAEAPAGPGARDVAALNGALERERAAVALYRAGLGLTRGADRAAVARLLEQEREHARGLSEAIRDLGGTPRREGTAPAPRIAAGDFMRVAADAEDAEIRFYLDLLPVLSDGRLRQTAAAIMANEAQHSAVLTGLRAPGRPDLQAPRAFVGGR